MSEDDYDDEDDMPTMEFLIEDGEIKKKPETVEMTLDDFYKLQKGLELLKDKYPEISKECFS